MEKIKKYVWIGACIGVFSFLLLLATLWGDAALSGLSRNVIFHAMDLYTL